MREYLQANLLCPASSQSKSDIGRVLSFFNLPGTQTLSIYELTDVIVVAENENFVFAVFQVVSLCLKDF